MNARTIGIAVLSAFSLCGWQAASAPQYDYLLINGRVVDGSGNPWFYGDLGIKGDKIVFIGNAGEDARATRVIDAKGLIIAPGFIDMLGQSEMNQLIDNRAVSKITQGVTTEITGEGGSIAPVNDQQIKEQEDFTRHFHITIDWHTLDQYFRRFERNGSAINLGTYVGAAQVRQYVLGNADRAPTAEELRRMQDLVDEAMRQGALGISTSLIYAPGNYAQTDELIALARVAAKYHGVYASHMRNESDREDLALAEAFRIGREANIPVEIFHLKVAGKQNWGKMQNVVAMIQQQRDQGLDVTADHYPYLAGATSLGASIPPKYHVGGVDAMIARLKDPATRAQIKKEMMSPPQGNAENLFYGSGGPEGVMVISVLNPELKKYEGKRVSEIAKMPGPMQRPDPLDTVIDMVIADRDNVGAIYFLMTEDDLRTAMKQPWVSVGTDFGACALQGPLGESPCHPRAWGTFPRILGRYVRQDHVLTLEDAIRKFTSLPAQRERLDRRGLLRDGYFADITVFNPETVNDVATYENPNRISTGIEYVFVNGALEVEHEKPTGKLSGRALRGPGYKASP
jgi:N-acyl-D-amino-acid deacylase